MPKVLNARTDFDHSNAVWVDRRSPYGNRYVMSFESERNMVCDAFEVNVLPNLDVSPLRGKDLICWCTPKRCHADSILRKANI